MAKKYEVGDPVLLDGVEAGEVYTVLENTGEKMYLIQNLGMTSIILAHVDTLRPAP